jgi:hypothetical protein
MDPTDDAMLLIVEKLFAVPSFRLIADKITSNSADEAEKEAAALLIKATFFNVMHRYANRAEYRQVIEAIAVKICS